MHNYANVTFWPSGPEPTISLVGPDGDILGIFPINEPYSGKRLAAFLPPRCTVSIQDINAVDMKTRTVGTTVAPFDTAAVTVKRQVSLEDRLGRIESMMVRGAQAQRRIAARIQAEKDEEFEVVEPLPLHQEVAEPAEPVGDASAETQPAAGAEPASTEESPQGVG